MTCGAGGKGVVLFFLPATVPPRVTARTDDTIISIDIFNGSDRDVDWALVAAYCTINEASTFTPSYK